MERLLKLYIRYSIFIILLYSCQNKDCREFPNYSQSTKIPTKDLDKINDLISKGFNKQNVPILLYCLDKLDSRNIINNGEDYVNYICEKFNEHDLQIFFKTIKNSSINIYFDNIHEGLSTWNIELDYTKFTIIRNSLGKYYYLGKTDKWICMYLMNPYHFIDSLNNILDSKDFILRSFDLTSLSTEVKVINQILREEPRLRNNVKSRYNYIEKIDLIHSFLYYIHQKKPNIHYLYDKLLNFKLITDLKKNLLEMQFDRPDTSNVEDLIKSNDYEKLAYYYHNKKAIFLRKKYIGVFVFIVHYSKEEDYFYLEKHFIPSCKMLYWYFARAI